MANQKKETGFQHATKRCPECYAYAPLQAKRCPDCNIRLGEVDRHGMAKRTVNWSSYFSAALAIGALAAYFWWAFFRK